MQRIAAGMAAERKATKVYVVQMAASPAISYAGGVGYARTAPESGQSTTPGRAKASCTSRASCGAAVRSVGADQKIYSYRHAFNGFAARLSGAQAKLRKNKAVKSVWEDRRMPLDTNDSLRLLDEEKWVAREAWLEGQGRHRRHHRFRRRPGTSQFR